MKKVIVLGAGLIGKTMAVDLAANHNVTCADISKDNLGSLPQGSGVKTIQCDFSDKAQLQKLLKPFDLAVIAVPGFMGFETLKTVIESGKNAADISFFSENPFELDSLARKMKVTVVVDCGVAPGMCNIFAGYHSKLMKIKKYECLVGGLPVKREAPFEYKAPFSPADVIEEYTRPARFIENGKAVVKDALDEIENVEFDEIGQLEAFATDGLRTLATTLKGVPEMKEKTLRYPGHAAIMKVFRQTGLFGKKAVTVDGNKVIPLHLVSALLFPKWKFDKGEQDITVMRVTLEGDNKEVVYNLCDRYDSKTGTSSMARTTGYTCTAVASLILENNFSAKGVFAPEQIGEDQGHFDYIIRYLAQRNVRYTKKVILSHRIPANGKETKNKLK